MKHTNYLATLCVLAISIIPVSVFGQSEDTIIGASGTPKRGTITRITPQTVTMDSNGSETIFSVPDIKMLRFADEPVELETAKKRLLEGNVNAAKSELEKIALGNVKQDSIRKEIEYYMAFCNATLAMRGEYADKKGAGAALKKFVDNADTKYTQTHHFYEAAKLLGDLSMSVGTYDYAEKIYGMLGKAPTGWLAHLFQAKVLVADAQLAKKDYANALANYTQVVVAQGNKETARFQQLAKVGQAVCMAGDGKPDQGITLLEEIIKKEDPKDAELFGKAYNALGACLLKKQEAETDAKQKASYEKQALMAYLRTDILFWQNADAHAEALFHLTDLWDKVNKPDRATRARGTLKDRYGGSRWSQSL
jgi:hypothetical protein